MQRISDSKPWRSPSEKLYSGEGVGAQGLEGTPLCISCIRPSKEQCSGESVGLGFQRCLVEAWDHSKREALTSVKASGGARILVRAPGGQPMDHRNLSTKLSFLYRPCCVSPLKVAQSAGVVYPFRTAISDQTVACKAQLSTLLRACIHFTLHSTCCSLPLPHMIQGLKAGNVTTNVLDDK